MTELKSEFLFEMTAGLGQPETVDVGTTPHGTRRIVYVTGGTIDGPKIKGVVLPGGGDWVLTRPDGVAILDVRAALRTDDGAIVYVYYRGVVYTPPEVAERAAKGETIDPSEVYFRTTPVFETESEKYAWLNRTVAVGVGRRTADGVAYRVYAIL